MSDSQNKTSEFFCIECCTVYTRKFSYECHLKTCSHKLNTLKGEELAEFKYKLSEKAKARRNYNKAERKKRQTCQKCNKYFASVQSRKRHDLVCKVVATECTTSCIFDTCLEKFATTREMIEHCKLDHGINEDKLRVLMGTNSDGNNSHVSPVSYITNHIHNDIYDHSHNNITNNIVIFGDEDFSYINKDALMDALKTKDVLPKLCKIMRNNPNHPENRNVKVTDVSRGKVKVYTQNGWECSNQVDTFNEMIMEASDILDTKTESGSGKYAIYHNKIDIITDNVHDLDMAKDNGKDTNWGKDSRRNIMMEFVN